MPLYTQTFDSFAPGTKVSGWSNGWTVSSVNPVSGTRGFSGALRPDGTTSVYTGITARADMQVSAKQMLISDIGNASSIGLGVRVDANFDNGYLLLLAPGFQTAAPYAHLFKRVAGVFTAIGQSPILNELSNGDVFSTKVSIQGNRIQCKVWPDYLTEPSNWLIDIVDNAITAPGYMGLYYGLDQSPETLEMSIDDIAIANPVAYFDNFDSYTSGNTVAGWSNGWIVSTANPVSGAKSFTSPTKNDGDTTVYTGIGALTDIEVQFVQRVVFNTSSMASIGVGVRADASFQNGYLMVPTHSVNTGKTGLTLLKKISGTFTAIGQVEVSGLTSGVNATIRLRIQGSAIKGKMWTVGTIEPDWQISFTDTDITGAGNIVLYYALDGATPGTVVTLDNISVTNLAPAPLYTEDFESFSVGAAVTGWSNGWAVTSTSATSGTKALGLPARRDGQVTIFTAMPAIADMEVTSSQVITFTTSQCPNIGLILRSDARFTRGYLILCNHSTVSGQLNFTLFKKVSGVISQVSVVTLTGIASGVPISVRAQVVGSTITARVWNTQNTEPTTWNINLTDTSVPGTGYSGLYYGLDGAAPGTEISIDNIVITNLGLLPVTAAADNAAIVYSPYNWNVASSIATTINAGAYFYTKFTGNSCILSFDIGAMTAPFSQVWYRIDGLGAWTKAAVAENINCIMPADTTSYQQHLLEVVVKSTSETLARWTASATAVKFLGLVLDSGATISLAGKRLFNILVYGDSIAEGVRTINSTATLDTDRNDSKQTWSFDLQEQLGAEVGVVGFGGQGWNQVGSGGVPALPNAFNLMYQGVARSFTPQPDLVVVNMGTNDAANNVVTQITTFLNSILPLVNCKIVMLVPFNGSQAANLQTAINQCNQPYRVTLISTTGVFNSAYSSDTVHPYGFTNIADIAPALGPALKAVLTPALNYAF